MFDISIFVDWFESLLSTVAPLAFICVLTRIAYKAIVNVATGSTDLWR